MRSKSRRAVAALLLAAAGCAREAPAPVPPPITLAVTLRFEHHPGWTWRVFVDDREVARTESGEVTFELAGEIASSESQLHLRDEDIEVWLRSKVVPKQRVTASAATGCAGAAFEVEIPWVLVDTIQEGKPVTESVDALASGPEFLVEFEIDNRGGNETTLSVGGLPLRIQAGYVGRNGAWLPSGSCLATVTVGTNKIGEVRPGTISLFDATGRRCYRWRRKVFVSKLEQLQMTEEKYRELRAGEFVRQLKAAYLRPIEPIEYLLKSMPDEISADFGTMSMPFDELLEVRCR